MAVIGCDRGRLVAAQQTIRALSLWRARKRCCWHSRHECLFDLSTCRLALLDIVTVCWAASTLPHIHHEQDRNR